MRSHCNHKFVEAIIAILENIAFLNTGATIKELAADCGISYSSALRIVRTFVNRGWLKEMPGGRFVISYGLMKIVDPMKEYELLSQLFTEPIQQTADKIGLTIKLSVRQGDYSISIQEVATDRVIRIAVKKGTTYHLVMPSTGNVLIHRCNDREIDRIIDAAPNECWKSQTPADVRARLRSIMELGFLKDMGVYSKECYTCAAPIEDQTGNVLAAVTALGFPRSFKYRKDEFIASQMRELGNECSSILQRSNRKQSNKENIVQSLLAASQPR